MPHTPSQVLAAELFARAAALRVEYHRKQIAAELERLDLAALPEADWLRLCITLNRLGWLGVDTFHRRQGLARVPSAFADSTPKLDTDHE